MTEHIFSVVELNEHLEPAIAQITPDVIRVRGTLTTWKASRAWQRGELVTHIDDDVAARLSLGCTAKRGKGIARNVAIAGTSIVTPIDVTVTGKLTFHPRFGLRFEVVDIDPASITEAASETKRDDLLAEFANRGLIDRQRNLETPTIKTIGLISPQSGEAGRTDALEILNPIGLPIIEKRVLTGGSKAASRIATAIAQLEPRTDVIAIVRGGGATSDLHVWDDATVAKAIVRCDTPIIVGVGHSTDDHIARRVAWHGANTPTAAAQHLKHLIAPEPVLAAAAQPAIPSPPQPSPIPDIARHGHIAPAPIRPRRALTRLAIAAVIVIAVVVAYLLGLSR